MSAATTAKDLINCYWKTRKTPEQWGAQASMLVNTRKCQAVVGPERAWKLPSPSPPRPVHLFHLLILSVSFTVNP